MRVEYSNLEPQTLFIPENDVEGEYEQIVTAAPQKNLLMAVFVYTNE